MHLSRKLLGALALSLTVTPLFHDRDAVACGGEFSNPSQNVEVASHRMILSISQAQSTLYDEIQYSGNPADFAWVLPIKGTVTVGLSSDALMAELDQLTAVTVNAPGVFCGCCENGGDSSGASGSGGGSGTGGGVTVISQMVVGPYQTVQLSSTNPTALTDWLTMNGYAVPSGFGPVISQYVSGGFDFLALKLVPGMGVAAMRPVSVTTPGASPVLPLRMVAAGAGTTLPMTLFVVGEGRYDPTNFPSFAIDQSQIVWDFNSETSNYATLEQQGFNKSGGDGWLVEYAMPTSESQITSDILNLAMTDPADSGYADSMGNGAPAAAQADLTTLFDGVAESSMWVTRLFAQMPRTALTSDLTLGASTSQAQVNNNITAVKYVNCAGCGGSGTSSNGGSGGATTGSGGTTGTGKTTGSGKTTTGSGKTTTGSGAASGTGASNPGTSTGCSSCSIGDTGSAPLAVGGAIAALALAASRRRRAR